MKYIYIQPRQTGKTTRAIYEFNKDPENSIFITHKRDMIRHLLDMGFPKKYEHKIFTQETYNSLGNYGKLRKNSDRVIIDEYLYFSNENQKNIYFKLHQNGFKELYIFSSPSKTYSKESYELGRAVKNNPSLLDLNLKNIIRPEIYDEYLYLKDNFLTDIDVEVKFDGKYPNFKTELRYAYNDERYYTEIEGELFTRKKPIINVIDYMDLYRSMMTESVGIPNSYFGDSQMQYKSKYSNGRFTL